ncbi:MAG: dTDP-4-dehydrorhamnose 3,5-epimerase family protein [Myxococcota bacterium]|nr:dTDP-4-dehydrorhamnose 3,5-epimerase family protein [Myxococcota bacterium]
MKLHPLPLAGAYLLEQEPFTDARGQFNRTFDAPLLDAHGLQSRVAQAALSSNNRAGTLRGLHLQLPPAAEAKTISCWRGAIHDVIVDLRTGSSTRGRWYATTLRAGDNRMLYVPEGFAHGYQALEDDTIAHYTMSAPYAPEHARGIRWNDPQLGIPWPLRDPILSDRDATLPTLVEFLSGPEARGLPRV